MKPILLGVLFSVLTLTASAQDTAYNALRVVGRTQGKETLNRVLELSGRAGSPQPAVWKITLDEPRARGGVREIEVQRGKIISERTPASSRATGGPMNFTQLNLDSDGAFTIANQEAQKGGAPFDRVDYLLRSGTGGGAPVWQLVLTDAKLGAAGSIDIAADTGAILQQDLLRPAGRPPTGRPAPAGPRDDYAPPAPPAYSGDRSSQPGQPFRGVDDFFNRLGKRFERRSVQLESFFQEKTGNGRRDDGR